MLQLLLITSLRVIDAALSFCFCRYCSFTNLGQHIDMHSMIVYFRDARRNGTTQPPPPIQQCSCFVVVVVVCFLVVLLLLDRPCST